MKRYKAHAKAHAERVRNHLSEQTKIRLIAYGVTAVLGIIVLVQVAWPWNNLPLYAVIDGQSVGNKSVSAVVNDLNNKYKKLPIEFHFGDSSKAYRQPFAEDIGLKVDTAPQVEARSYTLWQRLIPSSLLWAHLLPSDMAPAYTYDKAKLGAYLKKELGESCDVKPHNASVKFTDKELKVVPAIDGGTCKMADVQKQLLESKPRLNNNALRLPVTVKSATIQDDAAKQYAEQLTARTKTVSIRTGNESVTIPQDVLLAWLDFAAPDSGITATVNLDKSADFFAKQLSPKVTVKAGTSKITTLDFTVVSRNDGATGQALDPEATIQVLNAWLAGSDEQLVTRVKPVAPQAIYTRTYTSTDEGLSALMAQFAQGRSGSFGVSFAEIGGQGRHASYQGNKQFRTASTYKLFVAYGTLKRVEAGQWNWSMQVHGGRDLAKCFDDMIVKSDNPCAETLLEWIGYKTLTNELRTIGLTGSTFTCSCGYPVTTANDLVTFNGALYSGQLVSASSTERLLSAMKRNIFRQGIPKGASGQTGDKVGFLNALLHDAAIVYSPSGTYVLTILTEGSSWGTIAELTRQIEALRAQ